MKDGDPKAVRHLRPETRPQVSAIVDAVENYEFSDDLDEEIMAEINAALLKLRAPFPPEMVEKLPRQMYPGAWDGKQKGRCSECHGYHPLEGTVHLDFVGHANCTNRLLEVDPMWSWRPLALTEAGTPLFTDGGLWIELTVCGVTRLGFGDGKSVKEVIGDAIRNAAMRFGVALDLWSKVDLHGERNPDSGQAQSRGRQPAVHGRQGGRVEGVESVAPDAAPRRPNQDALDSLQSVCDEHGYSVASCIERWAKEHDGQHIASAGAAEIVEFAAKLIEEATPDSDTGSEGSVEGDAGVAEPAATGGLF